jgi:hypothetical protein
MQETIWDIWGLRWEVTVRMYLRTSWLDDVYCTHLARGMVQRSAFVKTG